MEAVKEEDEIELSLELSIGGSYGKSVEMEKGKKQIDPLLKNVSRSDFSSNNNNNNNNNFKRDLEKKRKVEDRGKDEISEGGSIADSGEIYSNRPDSRANQCSSSRSSVIKRLRDDNSKSQPQPSNPVVHSISPTVVTPSVLLSKPPKPPNHKTQGGPVQQMPCVTTTGNGPQGKTITGFLCKYTKTEVSIVCVCHRRFFSPSEFVEHAGGVDIANPLRHITIVNPVKF